jgi:hypothetical protein
LKRVNEDDLPFTAILRVRWYTPSSRTRSACKAEVVGHLYPLDSILTWYSPCVFVFLGCSSQDKPAQRMIITHIDNEYDVKHTRYGILWEALPAALRAAAILARATTFGTIARVSVDSYDPSVVRLLA